MNLNIKIFLLCPVPDDQKPINEYIQLKENNFSKLIFSSNKSYFSKLILDFFFFFVLSTLISFLLKLNYNLILFNTFFSINILISIFLINFLRWSQLLNKFRNSRLFYEEGSWYDGQTWEKPLEVIKNDKLISTQKIQPILKRIKNTLNFLIFFDVYLYFIGIG
jgi:hypothetical protein